MMRLAVLLLACAALVSCQMPRNPIPGSRPAPPATVKPLPAGLDQATLMQIAQMVAQIMQQQNLMGPSTPYGGGGGYYGYNPPDPPDMPDYIKRQRQAAYYGGGRAW